MGHDIDIINDEGEIDTSLYISFNWIKMGITIHDFHGHRGEVIAKLILDFLIQLTNEGISAFTDETIKEFEKTNRNFWWGADEHGKEYPEFTKKSIYYNYMQDWLLTAIKYPNSYWYSDQVWKIKPNKYDSIGKEKTESPSSCE